MPYDNWQIIRKKIFGLDGGEKEEKGFVIRGIREETNKESSKRKYSMVEGIYLMVRSIHYNFD